VIPPVATTLSPAVGIIGQTIDLTINGFGLAGVTSVRMLPPDGLTVGAPSISPDGTSLTVSVVITPNAPQTLREVRPFAGAAPVLFADAAAALLRVSAPLAELDSMSPIVLQVGAAPVTLTLSGRNFQNASQLRVDPPSGITITALSVNAPGTQATATISAAAGAATGPRAVVLVTPAGDSSSTQTPANTLTLVNAIQGSATPIVAPELGVVVEGQAAPATQTFGPFASPDVGVMLETAAPPPAQDTLRALVLGVAVGPYATGVQVPPLTPTSSGTLVVSGVGLADVTAIQIVPASGITLGALTIAPDGRQVSVPLALSGASAGLRGVRVLRGTSAVAFEPTGMSTFTIGVGVPSIDSITPILEGRGRTFTLLLRGQNFQGVTAVTATPGAGIFIDNAPSASADGTQVSVTVSIAADAPLGANVFRVLTPGGATTESAVPANTFTVQP
jgi:hypothetical protein